MAEDEEITAGELRAICNDRTEKGQLVCNSYTHGFLGGIRWALLFTKTAPALGFCLPTGGVTIRRVTTVFLDYLGENPASAKEPAHQEMFLALKNEYPCKK